MKKFKFLALAVMAMLSTNAFAAMNLNDVVIVKDGVSYEVQSVYKNPTTGQENIVWVAESNAYTGATLNIPATVTLSVKGTDSQTTGELIEGEYEFKVVKIKANAFKGNTNITSVTIGANVAEIEASAFNECTQISSFTFAEGSALTTLGNFVFGNTPALTTLDFTNCESLAAFTTTPFIPSAGNPNNYLTTLTFSKVGSFGTALANLPKLATLDLGDGNTTTPVTLAAGSLAGDKALTTLTLPGNVIVSADPYTAAADKKLTSLTIDGDFTGNIAASAFAAQTALATVTFGDVDGGTLGIGAIGSAVTSLTFGELKDASALAAGAIVLANAAATVSFTKISDCPANAGIITGTANKVVTLGLGIVEADIDKVIVSNADLVVTTGVVSANIDTDAFPTATSITFGNLLTGGSVSGGTTGSAKLTTVTFGSIADANAITAGAFTKFTKLTTVNFNGTLVAGAVGAGSFGNATDEAGSANTVSATAPWYLTVNYSPTAYVAAFAPNAFKNAAALTNRVKLSTNRIFGADVNFATDYANFFNVDVVMPDLTATISVAAPAGSSTYYAKFVAEGVNFAIPKTNSNGDKVVVYEAYADTKEGQVYMLPLTLNNGNYIVKEGQAVIIRAWGDVDITATSTNQAGATNTDTHNYVAGTAAAKNQLKYYNQGTSYDYLTVSVAANKILDANSGKYVFAVANIEKYGLQFKQFAATLTLPAYTIYIVTDKAPAAGRLNVVWLDDTEATAIESVKNVAEDGVIYNLAGQKVDANYKGIIIKNGKKMIQK